jgi:hypothetical protein
VQILRWQGLKPWPFGWGMARLKSCPDTKQRSCCGAHLYIHMFAFRWKPGVTDVQKVRVRIEIRNLQGQIPGLLETWVGTNISPRSLGYELGGVMKFADEAALLAYPNHPVHVKLVSWLMPLIEPVEVDFSLEERGYGSGAP